VDSTTRNSHSLLSWKEAWNKKPFRLQLIVSLIIIASFMFTWPYFFDYLEARNGPQLNDWVLNLFPKKDISWVLFFFLYFGIFLSIVSLLRTPMPLLLALETYALVTLLRMLAITLFPLNPPADYIPLREPFAQLFVSDHRIISKDLFFSGHVATICALFFPLINKKVRWVVFICVVGVAFGVLVQRVHYTIDVLFAPVATFACFHFCRRFIARF
jgi:hypothetical protein